MTGYTVHTGSTVKFSNSWDRIFSKGSGSAKTAKSGDSGAKPAKKKAAAKAAVTSAKAKKGGVKKSASKTAQTGK